MEREKAVDIAEAYLAKKYNINKRSYGAFLVVKGNQIRFSKKRSTWEVYFHGDGEFFHDFTIYVDDANGNPWDSTSGYREEL